jgi:hypothetical protein
MSADVVKQQNGSRESAMMESFWGTLQLELLDSKQWQTRDKLVNAIFECNAAIPALECTARSPSGASTPDPSTTTGPMPELSGQRGQPQGRPITMHLDISTRKTCWSSAAASDLDPKAVLTGPGVPSRRTAAVAGSESGRFLVTCDRCSPRFAHPGVRTLCRPTRDISMDTERGVGLANATSLCATSVHEPSVQLPRRTDDQKGLLPVDRNIITGDDVVGWSGREATSSAPHLDADSYMDRLMKYVPIELMSAYVVVQGLLQSAYKNELRARAIALAILLVAGLVTTWFFSARVLKVRRTEQLSMTVLAFAVWVFAIGGWFSTTGWWQAWMGTVAVVAFGVLVRIIDLPPLPENAQETAAE